ncbi:MAG: 30S ribosomal protein S14 [Alphaproteobacteria bacterium]|nr:30S ribosomal protein S14 [Alphaproteobacteria bacterium]MCZ6509202.1 30S ribosomal protein S14 [Alphaproteobacteria bacterium]MCZ6586467.1 30S ribosomal protein S14 [Alphaproteobacteria bacterium]MCZ6591831.1 30S ribosomal protein S14 [Alphaproteobacteria bacterium]MCZ6840884.1 30S ribosomal protein S14 [Alphaproteobacteria bacterium]
MAKKSSIERNKKRRALTARYAAKRDQLKAIANDLSRAPEERFAARMKLAKLPRNSAKVRVRNRCELTGRPRGVYRKFRMSRIAVRDLASAGRIPGMVKSSW